MLSLSVSEKRYRNFVSHFIYILFLWGHLCNLCIDWLRLLEDLRLHCVVICIYIYIYIGQLREQYIFAFRSCIAKGKCTRGYIWPTLRPFSQSRNARARPRFCACLPACAVHSTCQVYIARISRHSILSKPSDRTRRIPHERWHFAIPNRALQSCNSNIIPTVRWVARGARVISHWRNSAG